MQCRTSRWAIKWRVEPFEQRVQMLLGIFASYWVVLRLAQRFAAPDMERPSHQRPKLSDAEQQAVLGLLASGMSLRAVAKQFDVSYASIDRIQRRHRRQQTSQAPQDGSAADAANRPAEPER
jgi:hypothetical protein